MNTELPFRIVPVRTTVDLEATIELFRKYARSLDIDLAFQAFEDELAGMPGKYSPPNGELLLARNTQGEPIGCVGLRVLGSSDKRCCEMKRLYTLPNVRGIGVGQALVDTILHIARELGYEEIKLDTLPSMESALSLYRKVGFRETEAYYDTPIQGTVFLAYSLDK